MSEPVTAFAPATVANVACGYDIIGFALEEAGDRVTAELCPGSGVQEISISGDGGKLPKDPTKNTAGVAAIALLNHLKSSQGIQLTLEKGLPLGSGMGSSAASAVAAVVAVNELLGNPLSREELLPFALKGEEVACGSAHADNAAPSLLGGFVLIRSYTPLDVVRLNSPSDLYALVLHPEIEVKTKDARDILRKEVPLKQAVIQWANTAGLVAGLLMGDYGLIGRSLEDVIIEPARSLLIPGFALAKQAAIRSGALGCSISGSGPSLFALFRGNENVSSAAENMAQEFKKLGIESSKHSSRINTVGARILDR